MIRRLEQSAEQVYYRVFSENAVGKWLTGVPPRSSTWAREALSLPTGNTATFLQEDRVPPGTLIERSRALAVPKWGRFRGGAKQFQLLIDDFKIATSMPALDALAGRLASSSAPGPPYELKKVDRILRDLGGHAHSAHA